MISAAPRRATAFVCFVAIAFIFGIATTPASAAVQNADQVKCIASAAKAAAKLVKTQGKENDGCLKAAQKGDFGKLAGSGQQALARTCLSNDVKGKVAKTVAKLQKVQDACDAAAPEFGFTSQEAIAGGSATQARAVSTDVLGLNLDASTLDFDYPDSGAPKCQAGVMKASNKLVQTIWKAISKGAATVAATATEAGEFETGVLAAISADTKIVKAVEKLAGTATKSCEPVVGLLDSLFRGASCDEPTTPTEIAGCATQSAFCRACRALNGVEGFSVDCDEFDNDTTDGSCPGLATARVITDPGDLIEGPLADGQVGDYLLENDVARFIIQDANKRDIYSVGGFGGNIIDAELLSNPGNDNFLEMQPLVNIETVINATSIEIVNDGSDGGPAIIRTCGPDDILDFVNASTVLEDAGFSAPASADDKNQTIEGCTNYELAAGDPFLKVTTTLMNTGTAQLGVFVGDFINAAGEVEQWGSGIEAGIGECLIGDVGALSFFGFGEAEGVDYAHVTIPDPSTDYISSSFATNGVTAVLHSHSIVFAIASGQPEFRILGGRSLDIVRYFGVGDGSGANAINLENKVKSIVAGTISGCVTVDGTPVQGARVTAGLDGGGFISAVSSTWVTDSAGCYAGKLPEGDYLVAAWREGTPYEGGGATPVLHNVSIASGTPVVQDIDLPATGTLSVTVVDQDTNPVPARVTVVGIDPSPEIFTPDAETKGVFRDDNDLKPFGIVRAEYTEADGTVSFDVEPGSYQVFVSRGTEYSLFSAPITMTAGATTPVAASIAHVIDTTGFVSSDFHVHGIASADSRVSQSDRVRQFAGEGVDNVIMTDHHAHTDLNPRIAAMGFDAFLTSTIGEEITTWDTGHYNAYPLTIDPTRPSGGSTDWGVAAPAGEDFASLGSYIAEPAEVFALATAGPNSTAATTMQINHIDSHFVPMKIDTSAVPPTDGLDAAGRLRFRMDPAGGELFFPFPALEVWNGDNRTQQSNFLNDRIGIWMNLLNQGIITTALADTDTHKFTNLESAGARSWTASPTDDPASLDPADVAAAVDAGKLIGGQGIFVTTRAIDTDTPANIADLTLAGTNEITLTDPALGFVLEITVQAPDWVDFDTVEIYANASTIPSPTSAAPELFSATPTATLVKDTDFTVSSVAVTGGSRQEAVIGVPFASLTEDLWVLVVVKGTDGVSEPMFPVYPAQLATAGNGSLAALLDGNLGESGTMALGFTNALYIDADGVPGFQAPLAP